MKIKQFILPFKIDFRQSSTRATAHAGLPLLLEALRAVVAKSAYKRLAKALGLKGWRTARRHLESLVLLVAAGGEHLSDLAYLRADEGLRRLLGFKLSSPTQAKEFLYAFHQAEDGRRLTAEDDEELSVKGEARIRAEGPGLKALGEMVQELVSRVQATSQRRRATLDVDATIIEAFKETALKAYEGTVGYQPQMAWWAEQMVWVADELCDGNVPAAFKVKDFLVRAFAALPGSVVERRLRGDSALYDEEALSWAADEAGIEFVVSADMSRSLLAKIKALPEPAWQPYRTLREHAAEQRAAQAEEREWAEVPEFVPDWRRNQRKSGEALRYVAIRVRSRQRDLLQEDGQRWQHFAVVSNMTWDGERLLRWHREKQGTVEHAHGVMKNELAGGTLPCGRFGANAAWWRLNRGGRSEAQSSEVDGGPAGPAVNALVANLMQLLKIRALPPEMALLRPKALRFRLLNIPGVVIRHARQTLLRLAEGHPMLRFYAAAREAIAGLLRSPEEVLMPGT
jgi:hypothetical protein